MKIYSVILVSFQTDPNLSKKYSTFNNNFNIVIIGSAIDVSEFNWFSRSAITEGINFASKEVIKRCSPGEIFDIEGFGDHGLPDDVVIHAYIGKNNFGYVVITDKEYNGRLAHKLGTDALANPDQINYLFGLYRKPEEIDKLVRIQAELEDIKAITRKNISQLNLNKEQLDKLIETTDELSKTSKAFAMNAKKLNRCCHII